MDVWNKSPTGNVVPPGTIPVLCLALTNFTRRPLYPFRFPEACPINFHVVAEINFCSGWTSCVWELSLLGDVSEFQHCLFQLLKCHIPQREHIFQKKLQNAWEGHCWIQLPLQQITLMFKFNLWSLDLSTHKNMLPYVNLQAHFQQHLVTGTKPFAPIPNPFSLGGFLQWILRT